MDHSSGPKLLFNQLFRPNQEGESPMSSQDIDQLKARMLDYYQSFTSLHPEIILFFSLDRKIISSHQRLIKYLGFGAIEEIIFKECLSEEHYAAAQLSFDVALNGATSHTTIKMSSAVGKQIYFLATFIPLKPQNGEVESVFLRLKDITKETLLEISDEEKAEEIMAMNKNFAYIFNNLHVGIWMSESLTGVITFASQGLSHIMQVPLQKIYEQPDYWQRMVNQEHKKELFDQYYDLKQGKTTEYTYKIIDGNGEEKWVMEQTIPRLDNQGKIIHLFGMLRNVTERMKLNKKLQFLAEHDALTGLPNYYKLDAKLEESFANEKTENIALLYIEVDNFHWIVNYLGYQLGDLVLKQIAERMKKLLSPRSYLAKVDRNSFVFLLENYDSKDEVESLAEEIIDTMGQKVKVDGYNFHVTASIGIAFYPHTAINKLLLMENAHTALYYAKHIGKNNYQLYSFDRDISAHKKYMLERDLREAMKNEEFELYYQPIIDPKNGFIHSVEALIRWNHQDWGIIAPDEFIAIAEEKHLIHDMEDWVFRAVCKQMHTWKKQGLSIIPISINVSPIRFLKPGFVENIKKSLIDYEIEPQSIELEITENTLMEDKKNIEETVGTISELGLGIALDDFGKGYSSFHYLQKYNVDTIKIDKMFIQQLGSEVKKNEAIIHSIIQLGKALGIKVVAEGVEELDQLEFLQEHGCDLVQGYLYSKPLPAEEIGEMLRKTYVSPTKLKEPVPLIKEQREQYRFAFPTHLHGQMNIEEVGNQKLSMGGANILIGDISGGGLRFLSSLGLPISSNIKLIFVFTILGEKFEVEGKLIYKLDEKMDIFSYGVEFIIDEEKQKQLENQINKMDEWIAEGQELHDTRLITNNPYVYLRKHSL